MRVFALTLVALLAAPVALAGPQPSILFLADDGSPFADGAMSAEYPQQNESQMRFVAPAVDGPSVWFASEAQQADRLRGPMFVGLWTDAGVVASANLTAWIFVRTADNDTLVASSSRSLSIDPSQVPDPASIVPPDPSDPEGAVLYAAALVAPLVMQPPMLLDMGMLDIAVPANASVLLGLGLQAGDGSPLPFGVGVATVKYGASTSPSFVYAPWFIDDPVVGPSPSPTMSQTASPSAAPSPSASASPGSSEGPDAGEPDAKDTPGLALIPVALALVAAAFVARRRM